MARCTGPAGKWPQTIAIPSGGAGISASAGATGALSAPKDMLNDVVVGLAAIGAALRRRADEQQREADARAEQQRLRHEQARMERARRDTLVPSADDWTRAERIRQLITEITAARHPIGARFWRTC